MKKFKNILVATDSRLDSHPAVEDAIRLAQKHGATVTIVDVVPEPSWIARQVTDEIDHLYDLEIQEKLEKLKWLAQGLDEPTIDVKTKVLRGKTSLEIVRQVIRDGHDLVVAVAKGAGSKSETAFGRTARRLLRTCPCAVWLVTPNASVKPRHVAACLDVANDNPTDQELNDKVYSLATTLCEDYGSDCSVLHAWTLDDEAVLRARLKPEQVDRYVEKQLHYRRKRMEDFLAANDASTDSVKLLKGHTGGVISEYVRENGVDLVVMGTVARSGLAGFFIGNTAEDILDKLDCSVLAIKPYRYETSVHLGNVG